MVFLVLWLSFQRLVVFGQVEISIPPRRCGARWRWRRRSEEETRKLVTSLAIAGESVVLFDNITGQFGNGVLDNALTATRATPFRACTACPTRIEMSRFCIGGAPLFLPVPAANNSP